MVIMSEITIMSEETSIIDMHCFSLIFFYKIVKLILGVVGIQIGLKRSSFSSVVLSEFELSLLL